MSDWLFHVVVATGLVCALAIAGCSPSRADENGWPERDLWGNVYPPSCRQDLSHLNIPVYAVDMDKRYGRHRLGWTRMGMYEEPVIGGPKNGTIYVSNKIKDDELLEDVVHHERCHGMHYIMYGNVHWHPKTE